MKDIFIQNNHCGKMTQILYEYMDGYRQEAPLPQRQRVSSTINHIIIVKN